MKKTRVFLALFVGSLLAAPAAVLADAAEDVIAITKAQWAAEIANKSGAEIMKDVADSYTEFNPAVPVRIDGKPLNTRMLEAANQGTGDLILAEMTHPKVQVHGDTAILTYNFVGATKSAEGEIDNVLAKSTRVYVKGRNGWQLVHANFAPVVVDNN